MDLNQVKEHIAGIVNLGSCYKATLSGIIDTIIENLDNLNLVDDIADVYLNVDKISETLFDSVDDIDLFMNVIFDITEVQEYLNSVLIQRKECTMQRIQNIAEFMTALTIINIGIAAVNTAMTVWSCT